MAPSENKETLRKAMLSRRASLAVADSHSWSRMIQARVVDLVEYRASLSVALYSPIQNEVDTDFILENALRAQKKAFFPKIGRKMALEFVQVFSKADLKPGSFGILEPAGSVSLAEREYEKLVVVVPGVAFDPRGNRLGRGVGWYDRALERFVAKVTVVALSYDFQVVESVPAEPWDQKVHYVITERRVIGCAGTAARPAPVG